MDGRSMARQQPVAFVALIASAMCSAAPLTASRPVPAVYGIVASIDGKPADGLWDYASIDSESQRLYLAQSGVTVLDLRTSTVMAQFASDLKPIGPVTVHSVVSLAGNMLAVSDSSSNSVRFFSAETGKPRGRVVLGPPRGPKDWRSPDELLFDPHSGYLVAVNGDRGSLSLIQPATFTVAGEIP